jgi:4-amino-4-deoxy-L-arabinose transferase-like glycosyltransferase
VWLFVLALAMRLVNGATGSLKLDDFHSLHHARADGLARFFEVLSQDNHPPLFFLVLRSVRALFGETPFALRLPSLVFGLALVPMTWHVARRLTPRGRFLATFLVAVSSLHVELSSDARMYSLLALASTAFLSELLDVFEEGRSGLALGLWMAVGLHTHYHFLYVLLLLGGGALALACFEPSLRPVRVRLMAGLALGLLLALPWYLLVFPGQLGHGLAPGGSDGSPLRLLEGYKNLVFWNVSVSAQRFRWIGLAGSAALLAAAALGAFFALRTRDPLRRARGALLVLTAIGVPALAALVTQLSPRAGFEWRYVSGALVALCWLAAEAGTEAGAWLRTRALGTAGVALAALVISLANLADPGEEDYRGAVTALLAEVRPGDKVVAADWQPELFPHALGYRYYAAQLGAGRELPALLDFDRDFSLVAPAELDSAPRVFACLRSMPDGCALLQLLRHRYPHETVRPFGRSVYLHEFGRD